jgi:hypothetical protein
MVASDIAKDTGVENPIVTSTKSRLQTFFYIAPLALAPFAILVFAILVVPTQWFAEHSGDPLPYYDLW